MVVEGRALRLFEICDLDGSGTVGISELEVALMIHDVVPTTPYLSPLDSFHVFDLDGGGDISWLEFKVLMVLQSRVIESEPQVKGSFGPLEALSAAL